MKFTALIGASALCLAAASLAAPGGGKGKPPKDDEPGGPLNLGYEETLRDGTEVITLSTVTLSNRQQVPLPVGIGHELRDGHYMSPTMIRLLTSDRIENDHPLYSVDVQLDGNGNILSATGRQLADSAGNCRDLADDGSVAVFAGGPADNLVLMVDATGGASWVAHSFGPTETVFSCQLLADGDGTYTLYASLYRDTPDPQLEDESRIDRVDLNTGQVETLVGPGQRLARFIDVSPDQNQLVWDTDNYEMRIIDDLAANSAPRFLIDNREYGRPEFLCDNQAVMVQLRERAFATIIYDGSGTQTVTKKHLWGRNVIC